MTESDASTRTFRALGKTGSTPTKDLETFPTPDGVSIVRMTSDEVTSNCPVTGQPDFEVVDIHYAPREKCIESKSLKLYFQALRDEAAFIEDLAAQIARDVSQAIDPAWVQVETTQKARGGISIVARATLLRAPGGTFLRHQPYAPEVSTFLPNGYGGV